MDLDLFLPSNVWGDDFGPHARRRSVREKLARGVGPSDGEHLDEVFDMEAELRDLTLQVANTRLLLGRKAITEQAALVLYKDARETTTRIARRTHELLALPVDEDVAYRLENASGKMKSTMTEIEEESNHLLRLLRAAGLVVSLEADEAPRRRKNPVAKKRTEQKAGSGQVPAADSDAASGGAAASSGGGGAGAADAPTFDRDLTMQGFLLKKKKDKGGQKKRWIVCNATHMIYYDKRDGKELGRLPLSGCKAVPKKDDDGSHMLLDCPEGSYIFSFIPSTEEQPTIDMWCEFITVRSAAPAVSAAGGDSSASTNTPDLGKKEKSPVDDLDADVASVIGGGAAMASNNNASATPENDSVEMFFAGYLLKRKEKNGKFSAPKRRYCVLDGSSLRYLDKRGGSELGTMQLSEMKVSLVSTEDGDCMLMKTGGDSYSFSADQAPFVSEWTKKLLDQGAQKGEAAPGTADGENGMSAYLNKKKDKGNGKFTAAKKRWCVCDGKSLTYYEKKGAPELGSLSLSGCQVSLRNDDDGSWVMILKTEDAQHLFGNIDSSTMQPWVDFIQRKTQPSGASVSASSAAPPATPPRRDRSTVMQAKPPPLAVTGDDPTATVRRRRVNPGEAPEGARGSANSADVPSPAASPRTDKPVPTVRTSPRQPRPAVAPPVAQAPQPVAAGRGTSRQTLRERKVPVAEAAPAPASAPMEDEFGI